MSPATRSQRKNNLTGSTAGLVSNHLLQKLPGFNRGSSDPQCVPVLHWPNPISLAARLSENCRQTATSSLSSCARIFFAVFPRNERPSPSSAQSSCTAAENESTS